MKSHLTTRKPVNLSQLFQVDKEGDKRFLENSVIVVIIGKKLVVEITVTIIEKHIKSSHTGQKISVIEAVA